MPAVTLSVIVPTKGRLSLSATVASVIDGLEAGDELVVVADGEQPYASGLCRLAADMTAGDVTYAAVTVPGSHLGNGQRDVGLKLAHGSHVCFLDDDDVYRKDTLSIFRAAASVEPNVVHVFKAEWGPGHHAHGTVLWREREFVACNVGTPMVVYPRSEHMPAWMDYNSAGTTSDFGWLNAAAERQGVIRWHEEIVATVRP